MKSLTFVGNAHQDLKDFPYAVRRKAGYQLFRVQCGLEPSDWKPMSSIGAGVAEIRLRDRAGAFRVVYVATIGASVQFCTRSRRRRRGLIVSTSRSLASD